MMYESFHRPDTGEDAMLCRTWATTFVTTQVLSIASVLLVVAVNLILARVLNGLVALEKHHTQSSLVVSRVTKVFLAQFCNTALLMLAINANGKYFSSSASSPDSGGFSVGALHVLNGAYADFSADWYNDVGVALMLTTIINSFSTHAYVLANYTVLKARRFVDRGLSFDHSLTKQDTQRDLEALYRGPKFDLAARYAQSLTSIFITYMFSAGMPLLHLIGFGALGMTYWADKFTFLRVARSPPLYDSKVASAAGSLLPYAVLLHCLVALWMFSNDRIFEAEEEAFSVTNSASSPGDGIPLFDAASRGQLISRVTRPQVVVLFAFFVAGCATVILRTVLLEYVPALVRSIFPALARLLEKPRVAKGIPNYFDGKRSGVSGGLRTSKSHICAPCLQPFLPLVCKKSWLRVARSSSCDLTSAPNTSGLWLVASPTTKLCRRSAPNLPPSASARPTGSSAAIPTVRPLLGPHLTCPPAHTFMRSHQRQQGVHRQARHRLAPVRGDPARPHLLNTKGMVHALDIT
jgi:hypothetical protein